MQKKIEILKSILMKSFTLLFLIVAIAATAQEQRNYLVKDNSDKQVAQVISNDNKWVRFPAYNDRAGWENIDAALKNAIIGKAEKRLNYQYQFIPASSYLAYATTGDRGIMEKPYNQNYGAVQELVLGELLEGKRRFIPQILKGIDNLCEMQTWALSAHLSLQGNHKEGIIDSTQNIIDLGAGRTGAILAWTYYFLHDALDKVRPGTSNKLVSELERRIVEPYASRTDFWWMALRGQQLVNNWNVWCNYNSLTCILLVEKDLQRKVSLIYKTMQSVDKFLNYYKDDGACEEGPSYWSEAGGNLYNYLELLKSATDNRVDIFNKPLVQNMATYIYKTYIGDDYYVNFADAHPKIIPDAGLIYDFGKAVNDKTMQSFGAYLVSKNKFSGGDIFETLSYLFNYNEIKNTPPAQPLLSDVAYPQTQVITARDKAGTTDGFYFAAKGGNNNESHNHNDVGSFILYFNANPLLIDIGSGTYTAQTFSSRRYELFNTRSENHNVPLINGVEQHDGAKFHSSGFDYKTTAKDVKLEVGIEKVYPDNAGVTKWTRTYTLNRGEAFCITDEYALKENNGKCSDNFMSALPPQKIEEGLLAFDINGEKIYLHYDKNLLHCNVVPIPITDPTIIHQWGDKLYRVELILNDKSLSGKAEIIINRKA